MLQVVVQAPPPTPPPVPEVFVYGQPPWETLPPQVILLIALAGIAMTGLVLWPLFRAIGRRIEGRGVKPEQLAAIEDELADLRARVAESEGSHRIMELEERLDFAERLLAERQAPRIEGGPR